ncbi:DinB family protein [Hymenobacter monticola]|uniref:DinB family protein n=1 Tax=Hymenobacter monticola TaxID=1705399 RepID=A0ABY4BCB8_9BACT|nr:DinB family protein [Hymenobacter monticola]UOE35651.1 DinB family protein [Hymenobacter monticola]
MLIATLQTLFARDLNKLKQEIEAYHREETLWRTAPGISNPAGNLCLHLVGNLNTYIGAELGHTGYVRHRDLEFSLRDVPRAELLQKLAETIGVVDSVLARLSDAQLEAEYPIQVLEAKTSTGYFLVHLATHLAYHLGQINYHRRLLDAAD